MKCAEQQRLENMKAYKQSKRVIKVSVGQQTETKPIATTSEDCEKLDWNELRDSIQMVMQEFDFSLCLKGLTTIRLITSQH